MKKRDYIFIVVVIVFCAVMFFSQNIIKSAGNSVCIYANSELYKKLPLDKDTKINIDDKNTVVIEDGYAYMEYATCPDKLCIKQGKTRSSNKMIVCLPNKVTVEVENQAEVDVTAK